MSFSYSFGSTKLQDKFILNWDAVTEQKYLNQSFEKTNKSSIMFVFSVRETIKLC